MSDAILKNIPGMKDAAPVPQRQADTLSESDFFHIYVLNSQPCLIKGAVTHWPASRNWREPDYLKKLCGHYPVLFFPHENHITFKRMMAGKEEISFAAALDRLNSPHTKVASLGLTHDFPEMRRDIGRFAFLTKAQPSFFYPPIRYFIHRNAGSTWHYHPFDETLMCQVTGAKNVGLLNARMPFHRQVQEVFFQEDYYDDPSSFARLDNAPCGFFPRRWRRATRFISPRSGGTGSARAASPLALPRRCPGARRCRSSPTPSAGWPPARWT